MNVHGYGPSSWAIIALLAIIGAVILTFSAFGAWIARRGGAVRGLLVAALVLILVGSGVAALGQSGRHGDGHAQHHDWYMRFKQPGSATPCCNARKQKADGSKTGDCRPVQAYQRDDGRWVAFVDGRWQDVPAHAVLNDLAPDGGSHACVSEVGTWLCFFGGSPRS